MTLLAYLIAIASLAALARANTEKVIFTAPDSVNLGDVRPGLRDLHINTLTPSRLTLSAALPVSFPTEQEPRGVQSWYLLQTLTQGQRYEVRVCWPATQPTQFWLETYDIAQVFNDTSLIQALALYAEGRQEQLLGEVSDTSAHNSTGLQSALFMRIWAAADFYTPDQRLMKEPSPVDVDIILDPFLFNIFPQSLLPTAAYIVALAVGGFYLSKHLWKRLARFLDDKEHAD